MKRVVVLYSASADEIDAIAAYSSHLTAALNASGRVVSESHNWRSVGRRTMRGTDVLVVQYNPFCYGRWGFAPRLILATLAARVRSGQQIALMVHEPYVPIASFRSAIMGVWQRLQLWALAFLVNVRLGATEAWAETLGPRSWGKPMTHNPVGSNFPDRRSSRAQVRQTHGWSADVVVLASMSSGHPSHLSAYVRAALLRARANHKRVALLNLGKAAPDLSDLAPSIEILTPGPLPAEDLSLLLAAADVFLAPFSDGVSTRRTSAMAAFQHGVPVVATIGDLTDRMLLECPQALILSPVNDIDAFAHGVDRALVGHEQRRDAARRLYTEQFDWPVIARRLLNALPL